MSNLTASSLDRASICTASEVLEQDDSPSDNSRRGSAVAKYLERVSVVGGDAALAEVPREFAEVCAAIDLDRLPTTLAAEVAFAYNIRTAEAVELGRSIERKYEETLLRLRPAVNVEEWVFGTADVFGVGEDSVYIGDHKGYQEVNDADRNLQVGFNGMCGAKVYGKDSARVEILRPHVGAPKPTTATLDELALYDIEAKVRSIHAEVAAAKATGNVVPKSGKHCQYCKAAKACPFGKEAAAVALATQAVSPPFDLSKPITRSTVAQWHRLLPALKEYVTQQERTVFAILADEPVELENGKKLGVVEEVGNERIDDEVGLKVLAELLDEKVANDCASKSVSKASIERGLKAHNVAGRTEVIKKIVGAIRAADGTKRNKTKKIAEY